MSYGSGPSPRTIYDSSGNVLSLAGTKNVIDLTKVKADIPLAYDYTISQSGSTITAIGSGSLAKVTGTDGGAVINTCVANGAKSILIRGTITCTTAIDLAATCDIFGSG